MTSIETPSTTHSHEGEEPPPPGTRWMALVRWFLLFGMVIGAVLSFWFVLAPNPTSHLKYTCPMVEHAFVIMDTPGECPICHMTLIPIEPAAAEARKQKQPTGPSVEGRTTITVELDRAQKIGVRTSPAIEKEQGSILRAPAYVDVPEQSVSEIHVRAPGFVEKLYVSQTGVDVKRGQPVLAIYSPDIYRAQEELLAAKKSTETAPSTQPLLEAARRKLELLGLRQEDIRNIERNNIPERLTAVRAPANGHVYKKNVSLGAYVSPESVLYELVDLSSITIAADVFSRDIQFIHVGTRATVHFPDHEDVTAEVDLVFPHVEPEARTTRIRFRVPNMQHNYRLGQYGEAIFQLSNRRSVFISRDAVIDTGNQKLVFVAESDTRFVPRRVTLGREHDDEIEVVSGVAAGEKVVSRATFLIDSESRLQTALTEPPVSSAPTTTSSSNSPSTPSKLDAPPKQAPPKTTTSASPITSSLSTSVVPTASTSQTSTPPVDVYTCPMHPEIHQNSPGQCPICGMNLEKKKPTQP